MLAGRLLVTLGFSLPFAALALAGCGGGGGSSIVPAAASVASGGVADSGAPSANPTSQPPLRPTQSEVPRTADAFVDAAGVNVHLASWNTVYGLYRVQIDSLLVGLGVRHVRDGVTLNDVNACRRDQQMGASGIHFDYITTPSLAGSDLATWRSCVGAAIEAFEAPNEYDVSHPAGDANWPATLASYESTLYAAVKGFSSLSVIAPALTSESAYASVGNLAGVADDGNMHDYFAGRNPGTAGWGGTGAFGTYGSLTYNLGVSAQATGTRSVVATETGYTDGATDTYAVPAATKLHYELRTLLEHWNAGVPRTYLYELADDGNAPFAGYGLVDANANPKPVYLALKSLLAHLADPGPAFTPSALAYTLAAPSSVHHTLLQRRDGSYVLALWLELPEWDPVANAPIALAPQSVTLTFGRNPRTLGATSFHDDGSTSSTALTLSSGGTTTLTVAGAPTIVDIVI
jgi:hypothetical protein